MTHDFSLLLFYLSRLKRSNRMLFHSKTVTIHSKTSQNVITKVLANFPFLEVHFYSVFAIGTMKPFRLKENSIIDTIRFHKFY